MSTSSVSSQDSSMTATDDPYIGENTRLLPKPAQDRKSSPQYATGNKIFGLWQLGALVGILLAYADTSLVWATHETIASRFDALQNSSWMMTAFTIGYFVTLPMYKRLCDTFGNLKALLVAYSTFCVGSTLCGIGQTYWQVILGRIITGFGASGMVSLASVIIAEISEPADVAVLRSYVNIASTIGLSGGGPLGGYLAQAIGWRWLFLGQVPIAIACGALIASVLLPKPQERENERRQELEEENTQHLAFDFPGAVTLAIATASLLAAFDLHNSHSCEDAIVYALLLVGALSAIAFLLFETFPGNRELLMPLRLLRTEIGAFCAGQLLIVASGYGFVSQIPPYFANTQGASDAEGGERTIPFSIGNAVGALLAGQVIKRLGYYKRLSIISLFFCIANMLVILLRWSYSIDAWGSVLTTFPFGFFGGVILSAQFVGLYHRSSTNDIVTAISMYYMSQQVGIALGISFSSGLLRRQLKITLYKVMADIPGSTEIIKSILEDSSALIEFPENIQLLARQAYLGSFWVVPVLALSAQLLTILPVISTIEHVLDFSAKGITVSAEH
ncbi:hypothetical protein VHEMI07058 [[Torrubiella] hemipterigena]|uniref:Major facilitator superfamily (MFS) profile domain-containing protein n=1 Tax=[Torrubiella] hemipterigena TaxID=1531966 RepID=A0A0A1TKL0_9HYPO|nr:hypothetical protein VHEMI07058 [[Torrubiella] hemipterigena]